MALGVLWAWAEVEAWFNTRRKLKPRLNKNTTVDVSNLCQTITNQPCSDMLAGFLGQLSIHNLSSFSQEIKSPTGKWKE